LSFDARCKIASPQAFHDDVRRAVLQDAHVEHAGNVFAADLARGTRLADEAFRRSPWNDAIGAKKLDGNFILQMNMEGRNDHAHSSGAQYLLHAVFPREELSPMDAGVSHEVPYRVSAPRFHD